MRHSLLSVTRQATGADDRLQLRLTRIIQNSEECPALYTSRNSFTLPDYSPHDSPTLFPHHACWPALLQSRKALSQLDLDSNGTLDVAEITAAVALLQSTRLFARRLRMLVVGLLIIILLLVCALFGVSYAAAVLAATTKGSSGSSPSLTNTDGTTLRTAAASLPGALFTPAGTAVASTAGRRLQFADEHPSEVFSHRRQLAFAVGANGRQLAVTAASDTSGTPPPLVLIARLNGAAAPGICGLASEGHYNVALPFDPYSSGVKSVVAHFKAATMLGCDHLDSFGFAADFGVVFASGAEETFWHVDCPPPVTAASACAVSRVYLIPIPSDMTAALSVDSSAVVAVPLEDAAAGRNVTARRLAPGVWPPPAISLSASAAACPSISGNDIVTRTGVGSEADTSWKTAFLNALPTDPSASPADQAKQACLSSMLCMAGYAVGSGMIFKKDFWTDAYAMSRAMGTAIANNFAQTMSLSNMKSAFATLGGRTSITCTNYYSLAMCGRVRAPCGCMLP